MSPQDISQVIRCQVQSFHSAKANRIMWFPHCQKAARRLPGSNEPKSSHIHFRRSIIPKKGLTVILHVPNGLTVILYVPNGLKLPWVKEFTSSVVLQIPWCTLARLWNVTWHWTHMSPEFSGAHTCSYSLFFGRFPWISMDLTAS